jgi:hypothetical protein
LKRCLGYASGSEKTGEVPYIEYILAQWPGKGTLDDFVRLFVATVEYFTGERFLGLENHIDIVANPPRI